MRAFLLYRLYAKNLTGIQYDSWNEDEYRRRCGLPAATSCEARRNRTPLREEVIGVSVTKRRLIALG
jgi:hypothetical protein